MDALPHKTRALAALGAAVAVAAAAPAAEAAPRALSVGLDRSAVSGRALEAQIRATDPSAPVTGLIATFGRSGDAFGSSACLTDSGRRAPRSGPFAPGATNTLAAPNVYPRAGVFTTRLRAASGGCRTASAGSVAAPMRVTVVKPGQRPVAPVPLLPSLLKPGGLLAPLSKLVGTPGTVIPGLLGALGASTEPIAHSSRHRCYGDRARFGRSLRARRMSRRALLCLLNKERRHRGLRRLRGNRRADRAARLHSKRMVALRFFSHFGPRGLDPASRLRHSRYLPRRGRWTVGEDIGFGRGRSGTPLGIFRAFMHSTPHRRIILMRRFRDIGLGVVHGRPTGRGGATYTLDFGWRSGRR